VKIAGANPRQATRIKVPSYPRASLNLACMPDTKQAPEINKFCLRANNKRDGGYDPTRQFCPSIAFILFAQYSPRLSKYPLAWS
jgi:hypothetical protein